MNGPNDTSTRRRLRVKIVPLAPVHLDEVMAIEHLAFATPWRTEDFTQLIENPEAINLAAVESGRVVGYSCAWRVIECAELGNIAVLPECQGKGVARALLETTLKACRRKKAEVLFLEVRASNNRAVELYERYGFSRIGLRRAYYSQPVEDALIMKLVL
jgi:[ribosomal protein S18]-alanine N-acetyltransferase